MANILTLDDNLELCKLIRTALERDGHRVETRQAGGELTEALCRWADCILLDVIFIFIVVAIGNHRIHHGAGGFHGDFADGKHGGGGKVDGRGHHATAEQQTGGQGQGGAAQAFYAGFGKQAGGVVLLCCLRLAALLVVFQAGCHLWLCPQCSLCS